MDLRVDGRDVSEFVKGDHAPVAALQDPLPVACLDRELQDLRRDPKALLRIVGPPRRGEPPCQGVGERRGVPGPARDLDGLLAEPRQLVRRSLVPKRTGESRHQSGPDRVVACREGSQRSLQEGDQPAVAAGASPDESSAVPEGGGSELLGQVALLGDVCGEEERLLGSLEITFARLTVAEAKQQAAPGFRVRRALRFLDLDREPEEADAVLVGEEGRSSFGRTRRVSDRLVDVAPRRGLAEVVGKLGEVRLGVRGVQVLQHLAHVPVDAHPLRGRQALEDDIPDESVREAHAADRGRSFGHDTRGNGFVHDLQELVGTQSARPRERVEPELASEDGREGQGATASVGQEREPSTDHLPDPRRDRGSRHGCLARVLEAPFRDQETDHLAHEQRVALGPLLYGLDHGRRDPGVDGRFDQRRDIGAPEARQRDLPGRHVPGHLRHGGG